MCRPARISTGRSSRSTSGRVSTGEPQSRSASAPASRFVLACSSASSRVAGPVGRVADVAVRVDEAGQHEARSARRRRRPGRRRTGRRRPTGRPARRSPGRCRIDARRLGHSLLGELELDGSKPGGSWSSPNPPGCGHAARRPSRAAVPPIPGNPPGMPLTFGGVGPRPVDRLPLRPLAALRLDGRAPGQAEPAGHRRHHLAGLEEPVDQRVHLGHGRTGALGDALPAGGVDDLRVRPARPASWTG